MRGGPIYFGGVWSFAVNDYRERMAAKLGGADRRVLDLKLGKLPFVERESMAEQSGRSQMAGLPTIQILAHDRT
jgi:hypothetical protein